MKRSLLKDTFREIKHNLGRYLSILLILAVGVGFFAGVRAASPDMIETANEYYKDSSLMDLHFMSTLGLTDDDVEALKEQKGVDKVEAGYTLDVIKETDENTSVYRMFSLPSSVNKVWLMEGRLPKASNECVVENDTFKIGGLKIGDTIKFKLQSDDILDDLTTDEFTIVGVIQTPYYITYDKGTSTSGNGSVSSYVMVLPETFKADYYTDIYVTLTATQSMSFNTTIYKDTVSNYADSLADFISERELARTTQVKDDAQATLDDKKATAEKELADAKATLDKAANEISKGQTTLDEKRKTADDGYANAQTSLDYINTQLSDPNFDPTTVETVRTNIPAIEAGISTANDTLTQTQTNLDTYLNSAYATQISNISQLNSDITSLKQQITDKKTLQATYPNGSTEYNNLQTEIDGLNTQLTNKQTELNTVQTAYDATLASDATYQKLNGAITTIKTQLTTLNTQLTNANTLVTSYDKLVAGKKEAEDALATKDSTYAQLDEAQKTIDSAKAEYTSGLATYNENKAKADQEIADAQQEIDDIETAKWYTFTRDDNVGYSEYGENASRIKAIAKIFPTFFLLIAALVCLTSMTRMVEESRGQIGTYKALGYSTGAIASKYLIYVGSATLIGCVIGLAVGFKVLPTVIFNAYNIMYRLPDVIAPFRWDEAIESTILAEITTLLVTWLTCAGELRAVPASLLRPKSPRKGQRVLLERWKGLWKHLSFSQKLTIRNLFRYKKRMVMTIVGIAGCTALTLAAFGIRDSVNAIGTIQFDQIMKQDAIVVLNTDDTDLDGYLERSKDYPIKEQILLSSNSISVPRSNGKEDLDATLVIPEDTSTFQDMVLLRTLKGHEELSLTDDGVIISEKMATLTGTKVGENITFTLDDETYEAKVTGIAENYVSHYIWMTNNTYTELTGKTAELNQAYVKATDNSATGMDELGTILVKDEHVLAMSKITTIRDNFDDAISSLNTVVSVLLFAACALAFIVLYNLVNINITERKRELATIKVLGFRDGEVTSYLYRENVILTIMGILVGLIGGIFLHKIIMNTLEIDSLLFGQRIYAISFLYAALITMSFSVIVNIFTHFTLKKIDMIEFLKSVE